MASTKFLSYAGLQELINNKLGINLGGELSVNGADVILKSKNADLATIRIPLAGTTTTDGTKLPGLMTNDEKVKLAGIAAGGEVNQNAFSKVKITNNNGGSTALDIDADSKTDTINLTAGTNIKITGNASTDTITIANTYTYNHPDFTAISLSDGNAAPTFGGTFNAIGTLTSNGEGHLTGATFKTVTIPSLPKPSVTVKDATTPTANSVAVLSTLSASSGGTGISHTFNSVNVPTKAYVDAQIANVVASSQAIVLKGSVADLGTSVTLSKGDAFVCDATGATIGGQALEIGDVIIWNGADATTYATSLTDWIYLQKNVDIATSSTPGLIKIGFPESGKNYPVELNSSNQAFVNVPWSNTTYTASNGIKLSGTTFMHTNTAAGSAASQTQTTTATVSANGGTFTVAQYSYDEQGHITESYNKTITVKNGYSLPLAADGTRGGIQIGYDDSSANVGVKLSSEKAYVTITSAAIASALGFTPQNKNGTVTSITPGTGLTNGTGETAITSTGTLNLKAAGTEEIGGIKIGQNISGYTIASNVSPTISANIASTTTHSYYAVEIDKNLKAFVYIPEITTAEINALF